MTPTLTTGTQIATITIDGVDETIYAPSGSGGSGIENLVDGSSSDSLRQTSSATEDASYTIGSGAFTEGNGTKAAGDYAHAEGSVTVASGEASHAEGSSTTASQISAHAEGTSTTASNTSAHAEGNSTTASGVDSHAEGNTTTASGTASHAEGSQTTAAGQWTHAEGRSTYAKGQAAHAEGTSSKALSNSAHAEGYNTIASFTGAHAEGFYGISTGYGSHVEGQGDQVSIAFSTPVGQTNKRQWSGNYSRFFKIYGICNSYSPTTVVSFWKPEYNSSTDVTVFTGNGLPNDFPAEGTLIIYTQQASSQGSHAEGKDCLAIGNYSHAEGKSSVASRKSNHVFGEYNIWDVVGNSSSDRGTYVEIVGNGTSETNRSNARTLDWSGNQVNAGTVTATDFVIPGASGTSLSTIAQSIINIPTKTSDLSNDSGFITKDVNDLTNYTLTSNLATVATTGSYNDLTNTPSIPAAQIQSDWDQTDNTALDYIKNKPTIPDAVSVTQIETSGTNIASITIGSTTTQLYAPAGGGTQVQSDWTQTDNTAVDYIKNKPNLATVATSGSYADLTNTPTIPDAVSVTQIQSTGTNIASITIGNTTTQLYAPSGGGVTEAYVKGWVGNESITTSGQAHWQGNDTFLTATPTSDFTLNISSTSDSVLVDRFIEYAGSITSTNGGTLTVNLQESGASIVWMDGSSTSSFTMCAGKTYVYSVIYCKTAAKAYGSIHEVGAVAAGGITMVTSSSATPTVSKNTYASLTSTSISTITLEADSNSTTLQEWSGVFTTGSSQTSVTFAWSSGSTTINWSSSPSNLMSSTKYAFTVNGGGQFPYVGTIVPLLY